MEERSQLPFDQVQHHWLAEQLYRELLSRYLTSSFWMGVIFAILHITVSYYFFHTIFWPPLLIILTAVIIIKFAAALNRRGLSRTAAHLYFVTIFLSLFGVMTYVGGPFSVMSLMILVNLSLIAILEGRWGVLVAAPFVLLGVIFISYAMSKGLIHPYLLSGSTESATLWINGLVLVSDVALELYMLLEFSHIVEMALREARVRGQALEEVSRQAEEIANVERALREKDAARMAHLRKWVDTYVVFMERLRMGDYDVRLEMPEGEDVKNDPVLQLGQQLNATAESWKRTLARVRQARDHYLLTAWSRFLETQRWQNVTFLLRGEYVDRVKREEPITPVEQVSTEGGELRLPLQIGPLSLGVLILRRDEEHPWAEDEVETLKAIVVPLVQTIDNLRLVEESRSRAAREQLSSRIADRMRESLDLETVLQTAVQELGEAFGLREVVVQLAPSRVGSEEAA